MTIVNRTKRVMLSENIKEAKAYQEKKQGLIGSDGKTGLYMQTRWGVHTFGMTFSIDVMILDTQNRVVKYKRNLKQNRVFFWNPVYNKIIEIPTALLLEGMVSVGDEICIS